MATKITPLRLDDETLQKLDKLCTIHLRDKTSMIKFLIHDAAKILPPDKPKKPKTH